VLALVGCFDEDDYEETRTRGDLGQGAFVYGCYNTTDTSCDDGGTELPRGLALGSRFDLRFSIKSGPQPSVISPVTDVVRRVDGVFQVEGVGGFALLAVNGNREVLDFKHLRAAEVDEIRVQRGRELPSASLRLAPKESTQLLALPYDRGGVALGGALEYAWSSSDERLLSVESLPQLNRVRVRAGTSPGRATLRVALSDTIYEVAVQIGDGSAAVESDAGAALDAGEEGAGEDAGEADTGEDAGEEDAGGSADAGVDAAGGDL
jgi:hypothetical protein